MIGPAQVHVWRVALDAAPWDVLPPDEIDRGRRFHFDADRKRFAGSHAALRLILGAYLGAVPRDITMVVDPGGKPRLDPSRHATELRFNLSHSHELALVAVAHGREVGIDVEHHRPLPDLDDLAARFFSVGERHALAALSGSERARAFFELWTLKEAYLKACADGVLRLEAVEVTLMASGPVLRLADRPDDASRWTLTRLAAGVDYSAALAVEGADAALDERDTAVSALTGTAATCLDLGRRAE